VAPDILTVLTFLAGAFVVIGIYSIVSDLVTRDRTKMNMRLDEEVRKKQRERIKHSALFKNLGQIAAEAAADQEGNLTYRQRFNTMVEQSGLNIMPEKLMTVMASAGVVVGGLAGLIRNSVFIGLALAALGASIPFIYVLMKRRARIDKMTTQLPDAFDLMGRNIRAGHTISQALQAVADEFDQPIAGEFAYCYEQQNLGLSPEIALRDLARRTGLLEVKIFVLAMLVQQQSGGNLAELLDKLSAVIRERFRIRGKIKSLTAEGRMQALVLLILPVLLMLILMVLSQDYADALAKAPGMIVGMLVAEAIGALWIRRIVNFEF
jgi:tight adherence protein B